MFQGKFKRGETKGKGILVNHEGEEYEGICKNCLPNGLGRQKCTNGSVYVGEFLNGKREGQGRLMSVDGSIYEGSFKNNYYEGAG